MTKLNFWLKRKAQKEVVAKGKPSWGKLQAFDFTSTEKFSGGILFISTTGSFQMKDTDGP